MYTMSKKYSEDERLWTDWMRTVCVKDWGCVKDQSETVVISQAWRGHKKGKMAPFLDGGCQKYGRPLGPHDIWKQINISRKGDGPELFIGLAVIGLVKINI